MKPCESVIVTFCICRWSKSWRWLVLSPVGAKKDTKEDVPPTTNRTWSWVLNYPKGDLCRAPHGNFTFSDLPTVRREGETDHVTVSWNKVMTTPIDSLVMNQLYEHWDNPSLNEVTWIDFIRLLSLRENSLPTYFGQVENPECVSWFVIKWWSRADNSEPQ